MGAQALRFIWIVRGWTVLVFLFGEAWPVRNWQIQGVVFWSKPALSGKLREAGPLVMRELHPSWSAQKSYLVEERNVHGHLPTWLLCQNQDTLVEPTDVVKTGSGFSKPPAWRTSTASRPIQQVRTIQEPEAEARGWTSHRLGPDPGKGWTSVQSSLEGKPVLGPDEENGGGASSGSTLEVRFPSIWLS